ncbi:MAG: hypothetical protein Q9168_001982 [Polycauliona sp. 1 TL-2023]
MPASISPFLAKLLRKASQSPSADTIRPVYRVLSGSGPDLLDALPSDVVVRMQDQCKDMLQKLKFEDNYANLFCLAVLAIISAEDIPSPARDQGESSSPAPTTATTRNVELAARRCEARQYLIGKRALKTLDLVVLKMISACSQSSTLTGPAIVESLQLSQVILEAIDETDRAIWMGKSPTKISKLIEKVMSSTHSPEILSLLLLDESSIRECLLSILQAIGDNTVGNDHFRETEAALVLVESLVVSITSSDLLRRKILYLISTNALADPLSRSLTLDKNAFSNRGSDPHKDRCPYSHAESQISLRRKFCMMLLKTSFYSQHDNLSLDPSTASAMLDTLAVAERTHPACRRPADVADSRPPTLVSLFEAGSTPCTSTQSDLWRHRIKNELVQNAEYQYQGVVRTMEDICQDLERRCNEVEAPLRDEQAKSASLYAELEKSKMQIAKLTSHTHEQSLILEGIEGEKSELLARMADMEQEQNEHSSRTEDLRQELDNAIQQHQDADRTHLEEMRELELIQAAVIADKDEMLEAQDRKDKDSKARTEQLEGEVMDLRTQVSRCQDAIGRLESTISEQQIKLSSANTLIGEKQDIMGRLENLLGCSSKEKSELQSEVGTSNGLYMVSTNTSQVTSLSDTCEELRADLEGRAATVESQVAELNGLRCRHEAESSAQSHKLAQLEQSNTAKVKELHELLSKQAEDTALTVQQRDSRVLQLEEELGKLTGDLDDRDNELEEAQALNEQVVAFWSKQRRRNAATEEPAAGNKSTTAGMAHQKRSSLRMSRESPEHKRSRRTSFLSSSPLRQNKDRGPDDTGKSASCNKGRRIRRPLADLDAGLQTRLNISPMRSSVGKGRRLKPWLENANADADENTQQAEGSVCDSDFFGSTDQQLIDKIHEDAPHLGLPDDTTEF